jgi:signal transduction histidine kinase
MSIRNASMKRLLGGLLSLLPICLALYIFMAPLAGFLAAAILLPLLAVFVQMSLYKDIRGITRQVDALMSCEKHDTALLTQEGDLNALYARLALLDSRQKSAEDNHLKEKQAMGRFLEDVAHQLKTPLSSLLLKLEARQMESNEPWIQECFPPADRMTFLVKSLLTVARLDAGTLVMTFGKAPLNATVRLAADALSDTVAERGQIVTVRGPIDLIIRHDPRWLAEALENLIKNASLHSPEGGEIEVQYDVTDRESGSLVFLRVLDRGEGIPPDELPKVFDRFFRGEGKRKSEGMGIGLHLCKAIVTAHHGDVTAMNRPGGGAVFCVTLPLLQGSIKA